MTRLAFTYDDGGRLAAGFKGHAGDCVTRAIAIATRRPYLEVYEQLREANTTYAAIHRDREARSIQRKGNTPRNGLGKRVTRDYLAAYGFLWTPTMAIGSGCTVHLRADELPAGTLIASVSRHLTAIVDGVIHDTHNPDRDGTRCVYGYWSR